MSARFLTKAALALVLTAAPVTLPAQAYKVTNIISDGSVTAPVTDASFQNPWAISSSGTWWISTPNTGFNYVVPATTGTIAFHVIIPPATGTATTGGTPAGSVTTTGASGMVLSNGTKASFLFSTLDGAIAGWNGGLGTNGAVSRIAINNSSAGASYPGLAILNTGTASYILAPNFGAGAAVEVYDSSFHSTHLAGSFTDPNLPSGYAPYAIHILNNQIWVAYAQHTTSAPYHSVAGAGLGLVDVFDANGNFVQRAVTGGNLNAPWGIAFAPANFGLFSNDLLIGNFGDGIINVYDPASFAYLGQLTGADGKSLVYASLWELLKGGTAIPGSTSVSGGDLSTVYFTAGLTNQQHGLLAGITYANVSGAAATFGFTSGTPAVSVTAGAGAQVPLSIAPVNGFSGQITLGCTGLPAGSFCVFSPSSTVSVSSGQLALATVTLETTKKTAATHTIPGRGGFSSGILALLAPFASMFALRRRSKHPWGAIRLTAAAIAAFAITTLAIGCSDTYTPTPTPAGQSNVVVTATAGTTMQQATIGLTVK